MERLRWRENQKLSFYWLAFWWLQGAPQVWAFSWEGEGLWQSCRPLLNTNLVWTNSHTFTHLMQVSPNGHLSLLQAKFNEYPIIRFLTAEESFRERGISSTRLYQRQLSPLQCFWLIGRTWLRVILKSLDGWLRITLFMKFLNHDQLVTGFCTDTWGCTILPHFSLSLMACWIFSLFILKSHLVKDPIINWLQ